MEERRLSEEGEDVRVVLQGREQGGTGGTDGAQHRQILSLHVWPSGAMQRLLILWQLKGCHKIRTHIVGQLPLLRGRR